MTFQSLILQFQLPSWGDPKDLGERKNIEKLINEKLKETKNGHWKETAFGKGTTNLFFEVIDPDKACRTILDELKKYKNLPCDLKRDVIIALEKSQDNIKILYPKNFIGDFCY